jgi:hypothetical protein
LKQIDSRSLAVEAMQQSGAHERPAGNDTNRGSTIMIQMMMATISGTQSARSAQRRLTLTARQVLGFAIVTGGLAVIVAQAVQLALGG